jgi:hypothetical protein
MDTLCEIKTIYTQHETKATRVRTPKIPYRSYAECEAKGFQDGYAAAARDSIIVGVALIALIVVAFIGEGIIFG